MNNKQKYGQCHLCGETKLLTYEHVPPKKAFNQSKIIIYSGREILGRNKLPWDFRGTKGNEVQGGIGDYTLCGKCNNNVGSWYGASFVDFIDQGYNKIKEINSKKRLQNREWVDLSFHDIYPLRIIKQILAMFFSINQAGFSTVHSDLKVFVLGKEKMGIDNKRYGIYLYILVGQIFKRIGLASIINIIKGRQRLVSELTALPFGYVLEINPKNKADYCDLVYFANDFHYDDKINLSLKLPVYEVNTAFPNDHRTKIEVMRDYINNKLCEMQNKID